MQANHSPHWTPEPQRQGWLAVTLQILGVTALSGAIAYLATNPERLVSVATPVLAHAAAPRVVAAPAAAVVVQAPVLFRNPFDPTEVFEFPPGTGELAAREAVAETLMQRARDRENVWAASRRVVRTARTGP